MLKKLVGAAVLAGVVAAGVKVVKDILKADEEEKEIINLDQVNPDNQDNTTAEE